MLNRLLATLLFAGLPAFAQFSSAIQGTVTDQSKGAIPDAHVLVKNNATGVMREATTSPEGFYRVLSLGPGGYTITVNKNGFSNAQTTIDLAINEVGRADLTLTVGAVSEKVEVTATTVMIET